MLVKIVPFDTLFFRDGKPFSMGDDTWANGIFPPLPSTIYGSMRSAYISYKGDLKKFCDGEMKQQIGTPIEKSGNFKIRGLYLQRGNDILFPMPLDLVRDKNEDKNKVYRMKLDSTNGRDLFFSNLDLSSFLFPNNIENVEIVENGFIDVFLFKDYLNAAENTFSYSYLQELVLIEPKIGIKRSNDTHTAEEGHLYRVGMNRVAQINPDKTINEVSILVDFIGLDDFPAHCILKIGGEGKSAVTKKINDFQIPQLSLETKNKINKERRFKVYLTTPAIFKNGWLPEDIKTNFEWEKNGLKLKLLSAAVGKPISIGGWDINAKQPKVMRKCVPAGSVYYFEILEGDADKIIQEFHYKNISCFGPEEGFGLAFVGGI